MPEKKFNRIVYYNEKGEEYEIPFHVTRANMKTDFNNATIIEVVGVCKNSEEEEMWKDFLGYISPINREF